jgi:hypothetical protein
LQSTSNCQVGTDFPPEHLCHGVMVINEVLPYPQSDWNKSELFPEVQLSPIGYIKGREASSNLASSSPDRTNRIAPAFSCAW